MAPSLTRRGAFCALLAAPTLLRPDLARARATEAAARLQAALDAAAPAGGTVTLPAGATPIERLRLKPGAHLVGSGRGSRLIAQGEGPALIATAGPGVTVEGVTVEAGRRLPRTEAGLIEATDIAELRLIDCRIVGAAGRAIRLVRCGGRLSGLSVTDAAASGVFALDSTGLAILDSAVSDCGDNGVQVWRSAQGDDGTLIRGLRVARIRADSGGDGPYGNGISVFRAGGVICQGSQIRDCAFSAIRFNSAANAVIAGNSCARLGEVALYVEFAWAGAVVQGNLIEDCALGVSITNMDHGGRLAACSGNVVRGVTRVRPQGDNGNGASIRGIGVHVEADTAVTGNVVEAADEIGVLIGYGVGLRDVIATGNLTRDCPIGIGVSVAPGAGAATIADNQIVGARRAAIAGLAWDRIVTADLVRDAARHPQITLRGNVAR